MGSVPNILLHTGQQSPPGEAWYDSPSCQWTSHYSPQNIIFTWKKKKELWFFRFAYFIGIVLKMTKKWLSHLRENYLDGMFCLVAQTVKRLPTMWVTRVQSLGQEEPLQKEMASHGSILAWKIPCTEELGRLQSMASQRVGHDWATSLSLACFAKGKS